MSEHADRRSLWICAATSLIVLATTFWASPSAPRPELILLVGIGLEIVLAIMTFFVIGRPRNGWTSTLHTRARWRVLGVTRILALIAFAAFVLASTWLLLRGESPASPTFVAATMLLVLSCASCLVGAVVDRRSATPEVPRQADVDLHDVKRSIDARGWHEGRKPTTAELHDALERWREPEGDA